MAESIGVPGGLEAVNLRVAEQYLTQFGEIARGSTNLVLPANLADVGSMVALAMTAIKQQSGTGPSPTPPVPPRR